MLLICVLASWTLLPSCSRDYDIVLPANESKLAVECYLEDGRPLRALVSESTGLLDTSRIPPIFMDAVVTITHAGNMDTLRPLISIDTVRSRAYNYGSNTIVHADYNSGEPYRIDVWDTKGRHLSGSTRFLQPVPIRTMTTEFDNDSQARCITTFPDDPATKDYYRLVLKRNAQYDSIQLDRFFNDDFVNNGGELLVRSGSRFRSGDSIYATLYHLSYDYYQYLNTSQNALNALGNPFAASGEVVSNIEGGLGVFAALSYTQKSIRVP
jgi:hypothetical protein